MAGSEDKVANDATEDSSDPISDVQSTQGVTVSDEKFDNDAAEDSRAASPELQDAERGKLGCTACHGSTRRSQAW